MLGQKSLMTNRNFPWTLGGLIVLFILLLVFHGFPPEAFAPWIPFSAALCLQATTHTVPWIKEYFHQRNRITLDDYVMATRGENSAGSSRAVMDPYSVAPSVGGSRGNLIRVWRSHPLEFDHMDHFTAESQMRRDAPDNGIILDLESGRYGDSQSSADSAGSRERLI